MAESYSDFFYRVSGKRPLPYQERFAANPFSPTLLIIPTGLGKTEAVVVPWLFAQAQENADAPTRLAFVLPRRNLTSQTAARIKGLVKAAGLEGRIELLELMGGSADNDKAVQPGRPTVIVSTQDLFFSRALNRGYARRPARWPIEFALYNQDCLIVLDEIQLMDDALATSTQLAAFRQAFGTYGTAPCVWMSATADPEWLRTVDFRGLPPTLSLDDDDRRHPIVRQRVGAAKSLAPAPDSCGSPAGCAQFVLGQHQAGTRTLVIANAVARAREIAGAIRKRFPGVILLHSRFRPADRQATESLLGTLPPEGQIVVATQVLEAGIDITSSRLITDAAPWGSLVQRFGRVNRYGDDSASEIWWVERPTFTKQKDPTAPYAAEEVARAVERLRGLRSAAPSDLRGDDGPAPWQNVLRRSDLLDLFDTSADLTGNDLDVSRFIRATDDKNVYLAWRKWEGEGSPPDMLPDLDDRELCPVPIGEAREFARKHKGVYTWSFAGDEWVPVDSDRLYPGMVLVTRTTEGGYTPLDGWHPESKARVEECPAPDGPGMEGDSADELSYRSYRQLLRDHSDRVVEAMDAILANERLPSDIATALRSAAARHDWGKAHPVFQETMRGGDSSGDLLAKRVGRANHKQRHFRHELASALAMLATGESDLCAYLAAAHHGRIRMSIRSMPGEDDQNLARGIREGETLPGAEIATGVVVPDVTLSLAPMEFGAEGGSWTERMLRLRDSLGPFRLAYLEMLLRAADWEASEHPYQEASACTN